MGELTKKIRNCYNSVGSVAGSGVVGRQVPHSPEQEEHGVQSLAPRVLPQWGGECVRDVILLHQQQQRVRQHLRSPRRAGWVHATAPGRTSLGAARAA